MAKTQSFENHTAWNPPFHFILAPIFLINFVVSIVVAVREWPVHPALHLWLVVISFALLILLGVMRMSAVGVQDRVIRLEERLRIAALVPAANPLTLSTPQLIALRFASDAELPDLVHRTQAENLDPKAIKQSIVAWRPDYQRI